MWIVVGLVHNEGHEDVVVKFVCSCRSICKCNCIHSCSCWRQLFNNCFPSLSLSLNFNLLLLVVGLVHNEGHEYVVVKFVVVFVNVVVVVFVNGVVFIVVVVEDNFPTIAFHLCHCLKTSTVGWTC